LNNTGYCEYGMTDNLPGRHLLLFSLIHVGNNTPTNIFFLQTSDNSLIDAVKGRVTLTYDYYLHRNSIF